MSARWKIAHVLPALTKGGAERVVVNLANHAAQSGHDVSLVVGFRVDDALLRTALEPSVDVKYVSPTPLVKPGIQQYAWLAPWFWNHRSWLLGQDIVHAHLSFGSLTGTLIRGLRIGTRATTPKVVETYHAVGMAVPPWRRAIHALLASTRDGLALMAEDTYWRRFVARHPHLATTMIPNGIALRADSVDGATRLAYRQDAGIPDDCKLIVGTVGMLRPDREPSRYLPIFQAIAREMGTSVHFLIAGGGGELERMRLLVKKQGLEDRIHLPGTALDPAIPRSIMDVYVTLNVGNITGLAALEAAADGLPIVAIQQIADHQNDGMEWIWSSSDPKQVAARVVELLRSRSARQVLGAKQQMYVQEHHTVDAMAREYYALYQRVLSSSDA